MDDQSESEDEDSDWEANREMGVEDEGPHWDNEDGVEDEGGEQVEWVGGSGGGSSSGGGGSSRVSDGPLDISRGRSTSTVFTGEIGLAGTLTAPVFEAPQLAARPPLTAS